MRGYRRFCGFGFPPGFGFYFSRPWRFGFPSRAEYKGMLEDYKRELEGYRRELDEELKRVEEELERLSRE